MISGVLLNLISNLRASRSGLEIKSAVYGTGKINDIDVTKALRKQGRNAIAVLVTNELFGKDPAPNQPKRLQVEYSYGNHSLSVVSRPENSRMVLPEDSWALDQIEHLTKAIQDSSGMGTPAEWGRLKADASALHYWEGMAKGAAEELKFSQSESLKLIKSMTELQSQLKEETNAKMDRPAEWGRLKADASALHYWEGMAKGAAEELKFSQSESLKLIKSMTELQSQLKEETNAKMDREGRLQQLQKQYDENRSFGARQE